MYIFENKLLSILLWPLSLIYGAVIWLRNLAYNVGIFKTFQIDAKVISIGNISIGGTGKTPATIFWAKKLQERGFKVAILSRGYGRVSKGPKLVSEGAGPFCSVHEAGDEPFLLAQKTKCVPILVDNDRVNGAKILVQKFSPDVILLDDGFQHRRLARNIDIVLIDARQFLTNRLLLPAGPLRESLGSLKRAHLISIVCDKDIKQQNVLRTVSRLKKHTSAMIMQSAKDAVGLCDPFTNSRISLSVLKKKKIFALAGIANPQSFVELLRSSGATIEGFQQNSDHYKYSHTRIKELLQAFESSNAELLVTTEKDWIKLKDFPILKQTPVRIVEIAFSTPEISIDMIIACLRKQEKCISIFQYIKKY